MSDRQSRRDFFQSALVAGTAVAAVGQVRSPQPALAQPAKATSPNEKLNLGFIGVAAKGMDNLKHLADENVVALCDIDAVRLHTASEMFPKANVYFDWRRMLEQNKLDGVVVSTPDHMHAIPTAQALRQGLAVYCEKPLTHSIFEARTIRELTGKYKATTQMGTQIHAGSNYRRAVEIVQAGVIGPVHRVHVWQEKEVPACQRVEKGNPPPGISYDLWLGPAPYRPFHESHFHFQWRWWWDFGGGNLADMACHYMDLPFWALGLTVPTTVTAKGEKVHTGDNECPARMRVDYQFPARGNLPPVHLTWYHGGWKPEGAEVYGKRSAVLFEGAEGRLLADYGTHKLFMQNGKEPATVKATIPDSMGHWKEWAEAAKTKGPTTCNFEYGGTLTEAVLLGNVSYRAGGKTLEWDAPQLKATNCPEAAQFLHREYRKGWVL